MNTVPAFAPYPVEDVAQFILFLHLDNGIEADGFRLNICLYFCYENYMRSRGIELVDETPQAWELGPVFPSVLQRFGSKGNTIRASQVEDVIRYSFVRDLSDSNDDMFIKSQIRTLSQFLSVELYNKSRAENTPYQNAINKIFPNGVKRNRNGQFMNVAIIDKRFFLPPHQNIAYL